MPHRAADGRPAAPRRDRPQGRAASPCPRTGTSAATTCPHSATPLGTAPAIEQSLVFVSGLGGADFDITERHLGVTATVFRVLPPDINGPSRTEVDK